MQQGNIWLISDPVRFWSSLKPQASPRCGAQTTRPNSKGPSKYPEISNPSAQWQWTYFQPSWGNWLQLSEYQPYLYTYYHARAVHQSRTSSHSIQHLNGISAMATILKLNYKSQISRPLAKHPSQNDVCQ